MITPVNEYIVIKPADTLTVSEGGIVLPAVAQEQQNTGTVEATSNESKFKVGDKVLYQRYGAIKLTHNGNDIYVIKEREIVGVFDKPKAKAANKNSKGKA